MVGMLKYSLLVLIEKEKHHLPVKANTIHSQLPSCSHTWLVIHILLYATHVGKLNFYVYTLMHNRYAGRSTHGGGILICGCTLR